MSYLTHSEHNFNYEIPGRANLTFLFLGSWHNLENHGYMLQFDILA